jgi:purine-binding chemotaxis protein CheW
LLVVFTLDGFRYGLRLSAVESVFRAVEITPLPDAPGIVLGIVNVQGRIVTVVDVRGRFRLPRREIDPGDMLVVARTARRPVALPVDEVTGVIMRTEEETVPASELVPGTRHVEGVVLMEDGLVLIHDLDAFLSLEEEEALEKALEKKRTT